MWMGCLVTSTRQEIYAGKNIEMVVRPIRLGYQHLRCRLQATSWPKQAPVGNRSVGPISPHKSREIKNEYCKRYGTKQQLAYFSGSFCGIPIQTIQTVTTEEDTRAIELHLNEDRKRCRATQNEAQHHILDHLQEHNSSSSTDTGNTQPGETIYGSHDNMINSTTFFLTAGSGYQARRQPWSF